MNLQIFIWILFILLALPLATIAWTARQAALELNVLPTEETQTRGESPLVREPDGSLTQTFTMQLLVSERVTVTRVMGPATLSANGRTWAANAVLLGLIVTLVGMLGLFHFPNAHLSHSKPPADLTVEHD
jgi:hypothetical protein